MASSPKEITALESCHPYFPVITLDHALDEVSRGTADVCQPIEQVIGEVRLLPVQIDGDMEEMLMSLRSEIGRIVDEHRNSATEVTTKAVWDGHDRERVETALANILSRCGETIKAEAEGQFGELRNRVNRRVSRLSRRIEVMADLAVFSGDMNLSEVFDALKITVGYVIRQIGDIIVTVLATVALFLVNPVLGVIAGLASVGRKLWDLLRGDPHRRKREAQETAAAELERQFCLLKERCIHQFEISAKRLRNRTRRQCVALTDVAEALSAFKVQLERAVMALRRSKMDLASGMMRYVSGSSADTAYLDMRNKRALVLTANPRVFDGKSPLEGFDLATFERSPELRKATFAGKRNPEEWRALAREFSAVLKMDRAS